MGQFKGTPGPWTIDKNIEGISCIWGDDSSRVCSMRHDSVLHGVDAQLIATAPEMLEGLIKIKSELLRCDILDDQTEKFIDALVNKALGGLQS